MTNKEVLEQLAKSFDIQKLLEYYKSAIPKFRPVVPAKDVSEVLPKEDTRFESITQIGEIEYDNATRLGFYASSIKKELTEKTSKRIQYEIGKKLLKANYYDGGIFVFSNRNGNFRLSLIAVSYLGSKREFTTFRRYTYFVSPQLSNKTFIKQLSKCDFTNIDKILQAFSIEAVSEEFYKDFRPKFDEIVRVIQGGEIDKQTREDFALLFTIRIIFLGFVQKKGWLGGNDKFIQSFWEEYNQHKRKTKCTDEFYTRWLEPLFFEALNSEPGKKVQWKNNDFSQETEKILQMAPFLNGELFKRKEKVDDREFYLPDKVIGEFLDFIFQYNFTIDENTAYDEELELNPEFLGIIFERFVNQELGAIYTPRPEVDLMCRLSLLRWLERKNELDAKELHYLLFRESGKGLEYEEDQKEGNFSEKEIRKLLDYLENITVCDPAAGSGAFEVGMLQVINETIEKLYNMPHFPKDIEKKQPYERKKDIIARSLYGVEVQAYAVWINQLRLWLTLFIDMPDEMKNSLKPLLPCLNFKVRRGDSLVQRLGNKMFPVKGETDLPKTIQEKIEELKKEKIDFYYNRGKDEKFINKLETTVFKKIVDSQIAKRQKDLDSITPPKKQLGFGYGKQDTEQKYLLELAIFEKKQREIKAEIEELKDEYKNLSDEQDILIWNIEFSEIFYDKGGFDIIIGNPPYVRQEEITDPEGKVEPKQYKQFLCEMARLDYPNHFKNRKIDGKSDLYTFFYVRSLHLLNKNGVHCFICSNSWLDVGYGVWMQEFLLENVPVHYIIDNHARRGFSTVAINTIITLFDASNKNYDIDSHLVKFIAFKRPFEECIFTENIWKLHEAKEITKNDIFRIYPITAEKLYDEGWEVEEGAKKEKGKYVGEKWGNKYLRAPDIFFTILKKGKDKLIKLKNVAEICRGITTGCNGFFYLTDAQANLWDIERKFLKPVITTLRDCDTYSVKNSEFNVKVFRCDKAKSEITKTNALKYITWGEEQGYNLRPTCISRRQWWTLPSQEAHNFIVMRFRDIRNWTPIIDDEQYEIGDTVFVGKYKSGFDKQDGNLILNSTLLILISEIYGRKNLGDGLLTTYGPDIKPFPLINPKIVNFKSFNKESFYKRKVQSVFVECGIDPESKIPIEEQKPKPLPDRKELDDIVFDALNLTENERKDVYRAVCRLVWNRLSKARSV